MKIFNHPLVKTTLTTLLFIATLVVFYALWSLITHAFSLPIYFYYLDLMTLFGFFILIPLIIYFNKKWDIGLRQFWKSQNNLRTIVLIAGFFVAAFFFEILVVQSIENVNAIWQGKLNTLSFCLPERDWRLYVRWLARVVVGPTVEEIFFRGIILVFLLKKYSPAKAILFSALLFAAGHIEFEKIASLFLWGLIFGLIFYKTRSLLISIIAHSLTNFALMFINIDQTSFANLDVGYYVPVALCIVAFIITGYLLIAQKGSWDRNIIP